MNHEWVIIREIVAWPWPLILILDPLTAFAAFITPILAVLLPVTLPGWWDTAAVSSTATELILSTLALSNNGWIKRKIYIKIPTFYIPNCLKEIWSLLLLKLYHSMKFAFLEKQEHILLKLNQEHTNYLILLALRLQIMCTFEFDKRPSDI